MTIIEINALPNGAHRNQNSTISFVPEGWAVIPVGMDTPNFPFGEVETDSINGIETVIKWTALPMPEPTPEPVPEDDIETTIIEMMLDHEERLCLIELGITEV